VGVFLWGFRLRCELKMAIASRQKQQGVNDTAFVYVNNEGTLGLFIPHIEMRSNPSFCPCLNVVRRVDFPSLFFSFWVVNSILALIY